MLHNGMLSTGRLYVDEMLNECLLNVFTVLLICSSMKRCRIRSPHTIKYSLLHAIEMYLIVFMVNKSLSKSKSKSGKSNNCEMAWEIKIDIELVKSLNLYIIRDRRDYFLTILMFKTIHGFEPTFQRAFQIGLL